MGWAARKRQREFKAIETSYNGYRFRSRVEARWAVFFDALNVPYEYEKEGFQLKNGDWYLPDFYLPDWDWWLEIKGSTPSRKERQKIWLLSESTNSRGCSILCGSPGLPKIDPGGGSWKLYDGYYIISANNTGMLGRDTKPDQYQTMKALNFTSVEAFAFINGGEAFDIWPIYLAEDLSIGEGFFINPLFPQGFGHRVYFGEGVLFDDKRLLEAYQKARSARFEFGKHGK